MSKLIPTLYDIVLVDVSCCDNPLVTHDFQGTVVQVHNKEDVVEVEDQDNNVFTVATCSLSL